MFDIFRKKKSICISDVFLSATENQRIAAINLLLGLAGIDDAPNYSEKDCINEYSDKLSIGLHKCISRLQTLGSKKVVEDLKLLNHSQKEVLFRMALDMAYSDSPANHLEIIFIESTFINIGLNQDQQKQILKSIINNDDFFRVS